MEYKMKDQSGKITALFRYPKKRIPPVAENELILVTGMGIQGDCHADGSDRQISLLTISEKEWMKAQEIQGICFHKYKENILLDGICLNTCKPGDLLVCGEVVLEFTNVIKKCYPDICGFISFGKGCIFDKSYRFVQVKQGGTIKCGMDIYIVHPDDKRYVELKIDRE